MQKQAKHQHPLTDCGRSEVHAQQAANWPERRQIRGRCQAFAAVRDCPGCEGGQQLAPDLLGCIRFGQARSRSQRTMQPYTKFEGQWRRTRTERPVAPQGTGPRKSRVTWRVLRPGSAQVHAKGNQAERSSQAAAADQCYRLERLIGRRGGGYRMRGNERNQGHDTSLAWPPGQHDVYAK